MQAAFRDEILYYCAVLASYIVLAWKVRTSVFSSFVDALILKKMNK